MRTSLNELLDINLSYEEILDNLSEQTNNFTDLEGEVAFDDQYEAEVAMSILKNHYENVNNDGLDIMEALDDTSVFTITFSSPIVDDFSFPEEEIEESLNNFELRESDELNSMMDLMQYNDQFKDDPYVGSFWFDPKKSELFGVYSVLASDTPFVKSKLFGQKVRTGRKLHKDIWKKEQFRNRDKRFSGDHTLIPRGRVFQLEDGTFKVLVGDWFDKYPQCKDEILTEFQLPEDTEFVKDSHWDIGHGFTDEFLGEEYMVEKIVKQGSKYQVQSEKGKNLGTYDTEEEAKERLKQVEYFKHKG